MLNTRGSFVHRDIQRRRGELKFEIRRVWIADETLSRVFIFLVEEKLRSKQRAEVVKLYAN